MKNHDINIMDKADSDDSLFPPERLGNAPSPATSHVQQGGTLFKEDEVIIGKMNPWNLFRGVHIPVYMFGRGFTASAILVYGRLCYHAGQDGRCFPRQSVLAKDLGMGLRTVKAAIKELEDNELITAKQQGLCRPNTYEFLQHDWMHESLRTDRKGKSCTSGSAESALPEVQKTVPIREEGEENKGRDTLPSPDGSDTKHKDFIEAYVNVFLEETKTKYTFNGGKDGAQLKRLLKANSLLSARDFVEAARFTFRGRFAKSSWRSLGSLCAYWNEIVAAMAKERPTMKAQKSDWIIGKEDELSYPEGYSHE